MRKWSKGDQQFEMVFNTSCKQFNPTEGKVSSKSLTGVWYDVGTFLQREREAVN